MSKDLDDLRREIDIVDVISEYLDLERVGSNYRTNCPFHPDRTPSFFVSPTKQIFKCFGCGVGGDAIKFVSLYENVSYLEAARIIARKYGINLKLQESSVNSKVLNALSEVANFYHEKLRNSQEALEYLKKRNTDSSSVKRFFLGYSPNSSELFELLKDSGLLEEYEKTGNIVKIDENKYRDLFRGRLIFPIRNIKGHVVGFGGRSIDGREPKYINSPESEIFRKRREIFGIYEGRNYFKDLKSAILVEGYFDVVSMHQEGFRNTVAALGTAFTEEHAKTLSRLVEKVYLMFDADSAGRKAMRLAIPHLLLYGIEVYPVILPEGKDPHEFVIKEGRRKVEELLENSKELFEGILEKAINGEITEELIKDFTYFVSFVKDDIRFTTLIKDFSRYSGIPFDILMNRALTYRKVKKDENKEEGKLSFDEKLFLKGLFELKPEINLEELNLSQRVKDLAEKIVNEEYFEVPEEVINLKVDNMEEKFWKVVEKFKIDIPQTVESGSRKGLRVRVLKRRKLA